MSKEAETPKYTIQEGKCPFCGENDIDWWDSDQDGEYIIWKCTCERCNHDFRVYYKQIFDGISFDDDEGNFHDFDENGREP